MVNQKLEKNFSWSDWLMPRPLDWIAALLYGGFLAIFSYVAFQGALATEYPGLSILLVFLTVLLLMGIDRFEYWRYGESVPWRVMAVFLLARLLLILAVSFSDGFGLVSVGSFIPLFIFFVLFFLIGGSYGLSGQAWTMYFLGRLRSVAPRSHPEDEVSILFFITLTLGLVFIFSIAYLIRRERNSRMQTETLLHDLKDSHRQLQDYAERVAELVTTEERNRLAREIHDSLGHYMTVINVQLEKALAFRERNPQEADQAVKDAKHMASEALKEVRRSVGTLRNAPEFSLVRSLQALADNTRSDQFTVELKIEGDEAGFSKQSLLTLYRAAQEGLTNIQKHAQASQVTILVRLEDEQALLSLADNGRGFNLAELKNLKDKPHYGLQGIRERLELIRGSFNLESEPNQGTQLSVTVPKNPLALVTVPGGM